MSAAESRPTPSTLPGFWARPSSLQITGSLSSVRRVIDRVLFSFTLLRLIICITDLFMGPWSFPRAVPSRFESHGVLLRTAPRLIWGSNSRSLTKQWASGYAPSNMQFFFPQCYLGFGGVLLRLLLRGCDDKRIFCWFGFLIYHIKDQIVITLFVRVWADAVQRPFFLNLFLLFFFGISLIFIPGQLAEAIWYLIFVFCALARGFPTSVFEFVHWMGDIALYF